MKIVGRKYWSRLPGKILNPDTGEVLPEKDNGALWSIFEWYHTLVDVIGAVQTEHGKLKIASFDPQSGCSVIIEHLLNFRPREDDLRLPDDLYIGDLVIGGNEIKLYKLEDLQTENLYLTTVDNKHVEVVMLDF